MYRVSLTKAGAAKLRKTRGTAGNVTRSRGGVANIGIVPIEVDATQYDINAIKKDMIIAKNAVGDNVKRMPYFNVEKIDGTNKASASKGRDNPTSSDLKSEAEEVLAEDKEIAEEVKKKKRGRPRKT